MIERLQIPKDYPPSANPVWLNRNVVGMGLTSLLSDIGHEMITTLLPGFLAVLGVSAAALGTIEGVADSVSSFLKLGSGWLSDRFGHRKPMAVGGYLLTGTSNGLFALAHGWPLVLASRTLGWFGRGFRTPLRNAILAGSVPEEARGRAFGFERAGDTVGAIVGPLLAVGLLAYFHPRATDSSSPFRILFLFTLIPGLASALVFAICVCDKRTAPSDMKFWATLKAMPRPFRRFLAGVGIFGMADYARTLLILAATQLLTPAHGVWRGLLVLGYLGGALSSLGFAAAFMWKLDVVIFLLAMFGLAGFSIAVADAREGAMTADLVSDPLRGTAYGVLGAINGVGDLLASVVVGILWTALSPVVAFAYAAGVMGLGAMVLNRLR